MFTAVSDRASSLIFIFAVLSTAKPPRSRARVLIPVRHPPHCVPGDSHGRRSLRRSDAESGIALQLPSRATVYEMAWSGSAIMRSKFPRLSVSSGYGSRRRPQLFMAQLQSSLCQRFQFFRNYGPLRLKWVNH